MKKTNNAIEICRTVILKESLLRKQFLEAVENIFLGVGAVHALLLAARNSCLPRWVMCRPKGNPFPGAGHALTRPLKPIFTGRSCPNLPLEIPLPGVGHGLTDLYLNFSNMFPVIF